MTQPNERAATSLRLEGPGLGLGLDPDDTAAFLEATRKGLIAPETACDKGMQDNFALRTATTVALTHSAT
ncbi:hypothetical protein DQ384_02645 [Sphaerisporangium album]|uniref:Uncharacterized protein n=1 Tax=Sphaerisporangium album TaxID=509200 RepID=A0A367FSP5_9ACTN|nr:hypothetical protein [Sphaerisporangium album]RCG33331.1 hypothetical protein DQ384_02645 [Sphaerisporangium album]